MENWEGKSALANNRFGRKEICCTGDDHNYMSNMCAKELPDLNFNLSVIGKISIFQQIVPNFTYSQKL